MKHLAFIRREALYAYIVAHHAAPEAEDTYCQWPRSA